MDDRELAETLLRDHLLAAAALTSIQLRQLPEFARLCLADAVMHGTGFVELRTRVETGETEVMLVPTAGGEPMRLTRMVQRDDQ